MSKITLRNWSNLISVNTLNMMDLVSNGIMNISVELQAWRELTP
jgi:hypothetical protein